MLAEDLNFIRATLNILYQDTGFSSSLSFEEGHLLCFCGAQNHIEFQSCVMALIQQLQTAID